MQAEILSLGTADTAYLAIELKKHHIRLLGQKQLQTQSAAVAQAVSCALQNSDVLFLLGILEPTVDGALRTAVWQALECPVKQGQLLPAQATVFVNDHGATPACAVLCGGKKVLLLPAAERELVPLFNQSVSAYLQTESQQPMASVTVGLFGLSEQEVKRRIADLMQLSNPSVTLYHRDGETMLHITAYAETAEQAQQQCQTTVRQMSALFEEYLYGVDAGSLQQRVVSLLLEKNMKIATAESCTAGMLSSRLTEVSGASAVFECGVAAYSNDIKQNVLGVPHQVLERYGAVSPQTAAALAEGARKMGVASVGVGITGVAGPHPSEGKPVGTVYVALSDGTRVWVKQIEQPEVQADREDIRALATSTALDLVRRYLEAFPAVMAGGALLTPEAEKEVSIPVAQVQKGAYHWKKLLPLFLALLLLFGALGVYLWKDMANQVTMEDVRDLYANPPTLTGEPADYPVDMQPRFYALYDINPDIRGWVSIADTRINHPVMYSTISDYYISHGFDKKASEQGVPFFSSAADFTSSQALNRCLLIFGNNTSKTFADLERYTDAAFVKEHPIIQMNTVYADTQWIVFGVAVVSTLDVHDNNFNFRVSEFEDEQAFVQFVKQLQQRSLFDIPVQVQGGDNLLLMTTATDQFGFEGARIVVAARQVREGEVPDQKLKKVTTNKDVIMPDIWNQMHATTRPTSKVPTSTTQSSVTTTQGTASSPSNGLPPLIETHPPNYDDPDTEPTTGTANKPTTTGTTTTSVPTTTTTTATTVTTTTASTTKPTQPSVDPPIQTTPSFNYKEEEILEGYFALENIDTGEIIKPTTAEELQMCLTYLVKGEMGQSNTMLQNTEAQKAQAVAAYSYVLYYCSYYKRSYPANIPDIDLQGRSVGALRDQKIYAAVGEVLGQKIVYTDKDCLEDSFCMTVYHSSSSGETSSCCKVWTLDMPYLHSVISPYDNAAYIGKYSSSYVYEKTHTMTTEQFRQALQQWLDNKAGEKGVYILQWEENEMPLYAVESDGLTGSYIYKTNYYYLNGSKKIYITGTNLRSIFKLRSHAIEVAYDAESDEMTLSTKGWGHGVGLSQYGAIGYANEEGWTYRQILQHYYSITEDTPYQIVDANW